MGWVVNATHRSLHPWEWDGIHLIGGWRGSRAGLDGCEKSCPHRSSIPWPSRPQRIAIPTEITRPPSIGLRYLISVLPLNLWRSVNHLKSGGCSTYRPVYRKTLRPTPTQCIRVPYDPCSKQRLVLESSWNVMAHGAAQKKWRENWRLEWVASTLHTTSEHGVSSITTADAHISAASSRKDTPPI